MAVKFLMLALCLLPLWANANDSFAKFYPRENALIVDYYLDEDGEVLARLQDALRAGETIKLLHTVELLRDRGRWRPDKELAQTQAVVDVSYDPLRDQYVISSANQEFRTGDTAEALAAIFGYKGLELKFSDKTKLARANPVKIRIEPSIQSKNEGWLGWFTLNPFAGMKPLTAEVTYLAE